MGERFDFEKFWLNKFSNCLDSIVDNEIHDKIMQESEYLSDNSSREEVIKWTDSAFKKLKSAVDEEKVIDVATGCACQYSKSQLQEIKKKYEETKDIGIAHQMLQEKFEDFLKSPDLDLDGKIIEEIINRKWGLAGKIEKDKIIAVKIPKSGYLKDYFKTSDPDEKRRLYCHCPRINTQNNGIPENLDNPEIFCYCGAGFYRGIWEEI